MTARSLSLLITFAVAAPSAADEVARAEHFEKKIRPILATHCYACHGPTKQKGGLRLDQRDRALAGGETGKAIVPGRIDEGELLKAVRYEADGFRMPPKGKLPADAITELERWIQGGAHWPNDAKPQDSTKSTESANWLEARRSSHWCWQPVRRTPPPLVKNSTWSSNSIDRFLLAAMERENVAPTQDADRFTLLRRLRFQLTGLPPTPEELREFANDDDAAAYERLVDRLLASPAFGEHWARHWLDLVRYSETLGHEFDFDIPNAWRYRDYVVRAINEDVPFDQFVVEHVAGDLLSKPRLDSRKSTNESILGTAFWWFGEAKQAPVDVRAEQADRVDNQIDVVGKAFLGLTVSCARCHDHKFDAISAADYYSLYGFVKSTRYSQASTVPDNRWREEIAARSRIEQEIRKTVGDDWKRQIRELPKRIPGFDAAAFLKTFGAEVADAAGSADGMTVLGDAVDGFRGWRRSGPAAMLADAQPGDPFLDGDHKSPIARLHEIWRFNSSRWGKRLQGSLRSPTFRIDRPRLHVLAAGQGARFNVVIENFNVIRPPIYGGLRAKLDDPIPKWRTIEVAAWQGREAYVEFLDQVAGDLGDPDRSHYPTDAWFAVDRVLLADGPAPSPPKRKDPIKSTSSQFDSDAPPPTSPWVTLQKSAMDAASKFRSGTEMSVSDARLLNAMLKAGLLDDVNSESRSRIASLVQARKHLDDELPDHAMAPVAGDGDGRDEAVFIRGNSKKPGPTAPRKFLSAIDGEQKLKSGDGSGRLALARRIVDPKNPLAARVVVNRVWRHLFGRGLVESPDNFGALGERPSHPELLDFLADEFMRDGWSVKRLVRRLATTRAFRLSSRASPAVVASDPQNRWFGRANVRRLEAEPLRDAVLAASGDRKAKMFGPGTLVHLDAFADGRGKPASGPLDGDGRRTLYLSVRRNFPSSFLSAFDAPVPAGPVGKRSVSNVPAQSLILLNDPFVLQCASRFADALARRHPSDHTARLDELYLIAFGRAPTDGERASALSFLRDQSKARREGRERAAWADLCHAMFNAKEFCFLQ